MEWFYFGNATEEDRCMVLGNDFAHIAVLRVGVDTKGRMYLDCIFGQDIVTLVGSPMDALQAYLNKAHQTETLH